MSNRASLMILAAALSGCLSDSTPAVDPLGGSLTVKGAVVDFQTGTAIDGSTTVTASGLVPPPRVTSQGASFTIDGVPENSAFQSLASAPPSHRATFSPAVVVTTSDVSDVKAPAVAETYLGTLASSFGVTPTAASGVLFVRLVDEAGQPKAGVAASNLVISGASAPKFLDATLMPTPAATSTSASGWVVFFEVPPGVAVLAQTANATITLDMPSSPINAGTVTIADAKVTDGAAVLPTNVSFSTQITPIFTNRGCVACHSGNGPGKDLGGLMLDGGNVYKELVLEKPNTRVKVGMPEESLVLTMPSREAPPDGHPNITFASPTDPDYLKLLVWIREGAKDN